MLIEHTFLRFRLYMTNGLVPNIVVCSTQQMLVHST